MEKKVSAKTFLRNRMKEHYVPGAYPKNIDYTLTENKVIEIMEKYEKYLKSFNNIKVKNVQSKRINRKDNRLE